MREDGGNVDREALIRKKLLENFYGKSATADDEAVGGGKASSIVSQDSEDVTDDDDDFKANPLAAEDLDSPHFSAPTHTAKHVLQSGVHPLLETEEQLACQVRTLDSSMQTLVYENYSRFIDATDAIRSIGINVQANSQNLQKLQESMQVVSETSVEVETAVGSLRDQVVEKLRVKRLLQRLDNLLKLPATLRHQIAAGKYRWATKSYLSAYSILSKHSAGFESLQRIETECQQILETLLYDVKRKLVHWSGGFDDDDEDPPDPPQTILDIFECAGTPPLILASELCTIPPGITTEECQEMALTASSRLLERILDTHHIELQEAMFAEDKNEGANKLIPTHVLNSVLEASTLYSMSFPSKEETSEPLSQFVIMSFSSFLQHVRGELLDQTIQAQPPSKLSIGKNDKAGAVDDEEPIDAEEQAYEHISTAVMVLLQSVRQLASGLALPEVAIDVDLASSLVDQTIGLTEAMVRRRVDQKFYTLRLRVVKDCLAPFCQNAAQQGGVLPVIQMASVALSDSLQLVDDTIRSILASTEDEERDDVSMLKQAVEQSTKRFAKWLAAAMERLAGCESSDPKIIIEVKANEPEEEGEEGQEETLRHDTASIDTVSVDDISLVSQDQMDPTPQVETVMYELLEQVQATPDMNFAIAEMCRVAERSVMDSIYQSIATHGGGGKQRKANTAILFPIGSEGEGDTSSSTSERFRLAASRVLGLYSSNLGDKAARILCLTLDDLSTEESGQLEGPRNATWEVLTIVKMASLDCADLFGGEKRAGPVPEILEDEFTSFIMPSRLSAKSGLISDVERMFAEKVVVYPHPSDISDFQRNSVIVQILKVAFKALVENIRLVKVSLQGYRQLMADVEFFKFMIPHYVKDGFLADGSNSRAVVQALLSEAVQAARERCIDASLIGEDEVNRARSAIRNFMSVANEDGTVDKFVIAEE